MAYSATYDADDLDDIAVDGIGTGGVVLIGFISLIVIVAILAWLRKANPFGK